VAAKEQGGLSREDDRMPVDHGTAFAPIVQGSLREDNDIGPIVYFGNVPFASPWQRSQQLAMHLAETTDVVYVDPNRSFLQALRWRQPICLPPPDLLPSRLRRFRPTPGLPFGRSIPALNRANCAWTRRRLTRRLLEDGSGEPRVLVVTFPDQLEVIRALPALPLIYDLMDEPALFLKRWQAAYFNRAHAELLERADLLVTASQVLQDRYAARARKAVCITNGVRAQMVHDLQDVAADPGLSRLQGPRLGYVGTISHWFDFEAVRNLANAFPGGSVILVGPVDCSLPTLPANVHFTGMVPHHRLAPVLRAFDLGLIPFRRCRGIDAVNPVKLYEYMAAGLPILSSRFSEIANFSEFVSLYDNQADCLARARSLLARPPSTQDRRTRREFAAKHCWSAKARQFLRVAREIL
jgi:glycosyltransferase involved in cell wall biosynthesis